MNLDENIHNAVSVLKNTYENIEKLMRYCQTIAEKNTDYCPAVSKFLRYKSDNDYTGWMITEFFLLFQNKHDDKLENGWRDGALYVMEINLEDEDIPIVFLSKFEYGDIGSWSAGCSPASYWAFYWPIRSDEMTYEENADYSIAIPKASMEQKIAKDYWGLKRVVTVEVPLTELASNNVKEKVFGSFKRMETI